MTVAAILAASTSSSDDGSILSDILEVIGFGAVAGIGISIAFSLMLRGFLVFGAATRDGRRAVALANGAMGVLFAAVCVAAVVGGLISMLHR